MNDRPARSSFSDVTLLKEYDNNIKDTVSTLETGSLKKHMPWYEQEDDNKEEEDYARSELIIHNAVQEDREEPGCDRISRQDHGRGVKTDGRGGEGHRSDQQGPGPTGYRDPAERLNLGRDGLHLRGVIQPGGADAERYGVL